MGQIGGMARPAQQITVDAESKKQLLAIVNSPTSEQRMVFRANIILKSSQGVSGKEIAGQLQTSEQTVNCWRNRFRDEGIAGLEERPRSGRKGTISAQTLNAIITRPQKEKKTSRKRKWSCRTAAKEFGVSKATVQRVWCRNDFKPHLTRTFKISNDPKFEEKFWDVIGLYLNPPENAIVLCCDEKSQCQALERTQPGLPLGVGHIQTATHDYYRRGTVTLFAALNYLSGKLIGMTQKRHRHQEWLNFLRQIDRELPEGLEIHIILDNYSTHKHTKVKSWIEWRNQRHQKKHQRPRFELHFIPTSSSWLNLVERFFRDISDDVIRNGSFQSVQELVDDIIDYLAERNENPKRYVWKADGKKILEKISRARQKLAEEEEILKDN